MWDSLIRGGGGRGGGGKGGGGREGGREGGEERRKIDTHTGDFKKLTITLIYMHRLYVTDTAQFLWLTQLLGQIKAQPKCIHQSL